MRRLTERELNIAALRYAGVRVLALLSVLGLNTYLAFNVGYDVRHWQWWAISPFATIAITMGILFINEKIGGTNE